MSSVNNDKAYEIHYSIRNKQGEILEASPEHSPLTLFQSIYANTPKGKRMVQITDMTDNIVTINANHELSGETLFVDIEIVNIYPRN